MHSTSGTGFSREGDISDDQFWAGVLASSRLKPVPHEKWSSVQAVLAREPVNAVCLCSPENQQMLPKGH
jgi:hypothetical protein